MTKPVWRNVRLPDDLVRFLEDMAEAVQMDLPEYIAYLAYLRVKKISEGHEESFEIFDRLYDEVTSKDDEIDKDVMYG